MKNYMCSGQARVVFGNLVFISLFAHPAHTRTHTHTHRYTCGLWSISKRWYVIVVHSPRVVVVRLFTHWSPSLQIFWLYSPNLEPTAAAQLRLDVYSICSRPSSTVFIKCVYSELGACSSGRKHACTSTEKWSIVRNVKWASRVERVQRTSKPHQSKQRFVVPFGDQQHDTHFNWSWGSGPDELTY